MNSNLTLPCFVLLFDLFFFLGGGGGGVVFGLGLSLFCFALCCRESNSNIENDTRTQKKTLVFVFCLV